METILRTMSENNVSDQDICVKGLYHAKLSLVSRMWIMSKLRIHVWIIVRKNLLEVIGWIKRDWYKLEWCAFRYDRERLEIFDNKFIGVNKKKYRVTVMR